MASAGKLQFFFIPYGKLSLDLRDFVLCDTYQNYM
jgi:hypothetical protein